jgi:hypothetical protein|tara:strand:- start:513 stop:1016 length:504 start_codon:yes stop_codon:yes gene_type:complete
MRIHETFNKKDIVKIIQKNKINCIDIKLTRYEIVKNLIIWIKENDCQQKYSFLEKENPNKKITIKEKNEILVKAQQIISLHKNGYNYSFSCYKNQEALLIECFEICKYGDISSVRRAIKFVNEKYDLKFICNMSDDIVEKIEHKEKIKKDSIPKLFFTSKKCLVDFD